MKKHFKLIAPIVGATIVGIVVTELFGDHVKRAVQKVKDVVKDKLS